MISSSLESVTLANIMLTVLPADFDDEAVSIAANFRTDSSTAFVHLRSVVAQIRSERYCASGVNSPAVHLRLGTRGSLLARTQSRIVADAIERANPGVVVELVILKTTGDRIQDRPLHDVGGKGLFTKEIELALIEGTIDFAVHSYKDVPVTMPLVDQTDLVMAAVPLREDPRDAIVSKIARSVAELPRAARVGTGSLRRQCQLLDLRPDLVVESIRGNIDTRSRKLVDGKYDAIILATAGIRRAGLWDEMIMTPIELDVMLPAAGQGALAIQCRRSDQDIRSILGSIHDPITARCVDAERAVVLALEGDCHSPIAAFATVLANPSRLQLRLAVGRTGGFPPVVRAEETAAEDSSAVHQAVNRVQS